MEITNIFFLHISFTKKKNFIGHGMEDFGINIYFSLQVGRQDKEGFTD